MISFITIPLRYGPQRNNDTKWIEMVLDADESNLETQTDGEKPIVVRVAAAFPGKGMAYDAAHREHVWKKRSAGALILYTDASEFTAIQMYQVHSTAPWED